MRIRERFFKKFPLCVICLAAKPQRVSKSTELDHIIPLHLGGSDSDSNRQALCSDCHKAKTASEATDRSRNPSNNKPVCKSDTDRWYTIV